MEGKKPGHKAEKKHQMGWEMSSHLLTLCRLRMRSRGNGEPISRSTQEYKNRGETLLKTSTFTVFFLNKYKHSTKGIYVTPLNVFSVSNIYGLSILYDICTIFYYRTCLVIP
ncbi:hypothetical protein M5D96_007774, partial [Drosophila gunungcola]